jgi:hypothetical protein
MPDAAPHGPAVADDEELYRLITTPDWWVGDYHRPSSAAFNTSPFSVNIASQTTVEATIKQLSDQLGHPDGAVVGFLCVTARSLGFDPRQEPDPHYSTNLAHAHVYYSGGSSSRKRNARRLAEACRVIHPPSF